MIDVLLNFFNISLNILTCFFILIKLSNEMNLKFPGGEEMKGDVDFLGFIEDFLGWSNLYEKYRSENWNYFKKELEDLFPSNMVLAIEEVLEYHKTQEEAKKQKN